MSREPISDSNIQVGDIFHWNWGYDETNCQFFQVLERNGDELVLRELRAEDVGPCKNMLTGANKAYTSYLTAIKDAFLDDAQPFTRQIRFHRGEPYLAMKYGWCSKWNGAPAYLFAKRDVEEQGEE